MLQLVMPRSAGLAVIGLGLALAAWPAAAAPKDATVGPAAVAPALPAPVAVLARAPLGPGLGVALLEAGGRRLLVGWGKDGVRLVRDLGAAGGAGEGRR